MGMLQCYFVLSASAVMPLKEAISGPMLHVFLAEAVGSFTAATPSGASSSVHSAGIGANSHRSEAEVVPRCGLTKPSMWRMNRFRS